jgi:BlaI family transcriptional regulator, penicillinase repressor
MVQLTKAEEQIMQALWSLEQATVQDIREKLTEEPRPARTTVATILSILENKGFVRHSNAGRTNRYEPVVAKDDYSKTQLSGLLKNYFNNSFAAMASFFARENNYSVEELDQLLEDTRKELDNDQKS